MRWLTIQYNVEKMVIADIFVLFYFQRKGL